MTEEYIDLLWSQLSSASGIDNLDYGEAVTIGSVFGKMRTEIEKINNHVDLYEKNKVNHERYKDHADMVSVQKCNLILLEFKKQNRQLIDENKALKIANKELRIMLDSRI